MMTTWTLLSSFAVILSPIESSSQSNFLPDADADPYAHRLIPPTHSHVRLSPERPLPSVDLHHSAESATPVHSFPRERSRSPRHRPPFRKVLGFKIKELEFIRLTPYNNPNRIFKLEKYLFPPDEPIRLMDQNRLFPIPTEAQIVLSTSDGDALAILDKKSSRHTVFRGIYGLGYSRVKINMISGVVADLNTEESAETPLGRQNPIKEWFNVYRV